MKYYSDKLDKIFDTATDLTAEELEYDKRVAEAIIMDNYINFQLMSRS